MRRPFLICLFLAACAATPSIAGAPDLPPETFDPDWRAGDIPVLIEAETPDALQAAAAALVATRSRDLCAARFGPQALRCPKRLPARFFSDMVSIEAPRDRLRARILVRFGEIAETYGITFDDVDLTRTAQPLRVVAPNGQFRAGQRVATGVIGIAVPSTTDERRPLVDQSIDSIKSVIEALTLPQSLRKQRRRTTETDAGVE